MEKNILESITNPLSKNGIKVLNVKYKNNILYIIIDTDKIMLPLELKVIDIVNPILDKINIIKEEYDLKICSNRKDL